MKILTLFQPRILLSFLIPVILFATNNAIAASSILIWPLSPTIEITDKATSLWLQNNDKQSVFLQIRVLKWQQQNGKELYTEQKEIVASPPMAEIKPGAKQLIRLIRNIEIADNTEYAYRVLIDEIPRVSETPNNEQGYGVTLQMRYSIPLFVQGKNIWTNQDHRKQRDMATATQPLLSYQIQTKQGKRWLVIENKGQVHARLAKVFFIQNKQQATVSKGLLGYVLANNSMSFPLPNNISTTGTLQATVNEIATPVTIKQY